MPSRILDLDLGDNTPDLRLLVNVKTHDRYATVSHCWGKSQPLKLLQAFSELFQRNIAYKSLPKRFKTPSPPHERWA